MVNFYPVTHRILTKTKNQILLFLANICKQSEKIFAKKKLNKKNLNLIYMCLTTMKFHKDLFFQGH